MSLEGFGLPDIDVDDEELEGNDELEGNVVLEDEAALVVLSEEF